MNLGRPQFHGYAFFEAPSELRAEKLENEDVMALFLPWTNDYQLNRVETFDLNDPDLHMLRLAENETLSVCVFRFHDIDVFEIQWTHAAEDSPFEFWRRCSGDFQRRISDHSFLGSSEVCSAQSDDLSAGRLKTIVKRCKWKFYPDWPSAEIPGLGNLYSIGENRYILLSSAAIPNTFLGRDFAVTASIIQKMEFEKEELRKIRIRNDIKENQIKKLIAMDEPEEIEENLIAIKRCQTTLQVHASLLARLRRTLDINMLNLGNFIAAFNPEQDTLFNPILKRIKKIRNQAGFDLVYARTALEGIDSHLKFLDLLMEDRKEKRQRRIERWIAVLGIMIGVGQVTANIPVDDKSLAWAIQMLSMGLSIPASLFILRLLGIGGNK